MSAADTDGDDALSPEAAINAVWGPNRAWLAAAVVLGCGVGGGLLGWALAGGREWLRPWACAGYGMVVGGLASLLPRVAAILSLGRSLARRPTRDDADTSWWPLTLVASAVRETPALRRTAEDFRTAVSGFVPQARGLLAQRLWPACAAAFIAPALGLVSAWFSWKVHLPEAIRAASEKGRAEEVAEVTPVVDWSVVAWPMIISILAALALMLAVVLVDQLTRRLLQRWASTVRPLDVDSPAVQEKLGDAGQVRAGGPVAVRPTARPVLVEAPVMQPEKPQPQISAEELQGLGDLFKNG